MTRKVQRQPWTQKPSQQTMADKLIISPKPKHKSTLKYLVESFTLNSVDRVINKKHKGHRPDPSFSKFLKSQASMISDGHSHSGRKVRELDITALSLHFSNYVETVNLILNRVYTSPERALKLGEKLAKYKGHGYTLLQKQKDLCYQHNDEFKELVFERMHRNALELAARLILSNYTRRTLVETAIGLLGESVKDASRILANRYIPSDLVRRVRDACKIVQDNGKGFYFALGALKQVRRQLDLIILEDLKEPTSWRGRQRHRVRDAMKNSERKDSVVHLAENTLSDWLKNRYPFSIPQLRSTVEDFSASTENRPGQGYWYRIDEKRDDEVLFFLKTPPGVEGQAHDGSPYKGRTLVFRFLNWLPRASVKALRKAKDAEQAGDKHKARRQRFRAAVFADMDNQLRNTISLQHATHRLSLLRQRKTVVAEEIHQLENQVRELKEQRRCAPPRLILNRHRVLLHVPFQPPDDELITSVLGKQTYDTLAGADRGIRVPVALSAEQQQGVYIDKLVSFVHLVEKREKLRKQATVLQSEIARTRNNWDKKRNGQSYPAVILKKQRHLEALWRKVRRLDCEIARQVAAETVWWCEKQGVKTLYFENLKSYQAFSGSGDLSWALSTNLWGKIIETVRYMRATLGHRYGGIWMVNPYHTSKRCHKCGAFGIRVQRMGSTTEKRGAEYFYCEKCDEHIHADLNAARNIIHVQNQSSVVPGRTA